MLGRDPLQGDPLRVPCRRPTEASEEATSHEPEAEGAQDQQREDRVPAGEAGSLGWEAGSWGGEMGYLGSEKMGLHLSEEMGSPGGGRTQVLGREVGSRAVGGRHRDQTGGSLGRTMPEGLPKGSSRRLRSSGPRNEAGAAVFPRDIT